MEQVRVRREDFRCHRAKDKLPAGEYVARGKVEIVDEDDHLHTRGEEELIPLSTHLIPEESIDVP